MDKYEFNIKAEQIRKLVNKSDYETAMKIADTIDWKKVRNANLLSMVAGVYEKNHEYQDAKNILLLAFERAPIGKRLLYKLTDLALKEGNLKEAEAYYREFCELAGDDPRQHLLRYMILKEMNAPLEQQIHSLESYTAEELDEKWLYELAELYHEAGDSAHCVAVCDRLMLMFGLGKYVDKAMELKIQYAPLTKYQMDLVENRDKYEEKLRAVEQSFDGDEVEEEMEAEPFGEQRVEIDPDISYEKETIVAAVKQAEAEELLAQEVSRINNEGEIEEESELGKTRIMAEIRHTSTAEEESESDNEPELPKMAGHLMIEARTPQKGLELAIQTLKQIQKESGVKNQVAKITGSKLNKKGILANAEKLAGKDLIIEEAGDLTPETLIELEKLMMQDTVGMRVILIDNPKQMEMLHAQNPGLASRFECIGCDCPVTEPLDNSSEDEPPKQEVDDRPIRRVVPVSDSVMRPPEPRPEKELRSEHESVSGDEVEMDIDEFAQYCCKYASKIDCSITGKSMLALYERIEIMEEDNIPLIKASAEDLIEEAADRAEKRSIGRMIKGLFSSKYNKDGLLILKEEHFI